MFRPFDEMAGVKGIDAVAWSALFAPPKTPKPIVDTITRQCARPPRRRSETWLDESGLEVPLARRGALRLHAIDIARWVHVAKTDDLTFNGSRDRRVRVWHQSFTTLADVPLYRDGLARRIAEMVRPGDRDRAARPAPRHLLRATIRAPTSPQRAVLAAWAAVDHRRADAQQPRLRRVPVGDDVQPAEPGIRTLVDIPVIGYGETCDAPVRLYGRRFGMLCFMAGRTISGRRCRAAMGVRRALRRRRPDGAGFRDVLAALPTRRRAIASSQAWSRRGTSLVEENGVDVIMPSEMPLNLLLAEAGVTRSLRPRYWTGWQCPLKMAEMMVELRPAPACGASRRGLFPRASRSRPRAAGLHFYGLEQLAGKMTDGRRAGCAMTIPAARRDGYCGGVVMLIGAVAVCGVASAPHRHPCADAGRLFPARARHRAASCSVSRSGSPACAPARKPTSRGLPATRLARFRGDHHRGRQLHRLGAYFGLLPAMFGSRIHLCTRRPDR